MKFVAITLLAFIAAACAGPISVSNNNVGDIVTVGVNANAQIDSVVDQNIIEAILGLMNQQAIGVSTTDEASKAAELPKFSEIHFSPEMIEKVKSLLN
ncbi:CLUMA_CG017270, isoform A [Clunio marinus]|uniref:CLUMA_CG017270, isoform A n=1 Tax=Clunio marinus TaxID=568069 RepID=A0A1J1IVG0_9DIPT|nr:CLUMA_CG017270, isoform A [Clunio marinus]